MRIEVRLFARARDIVGADHVSIELAEKAAVGDLRRALDERYPGLRGLLQRSVLAVADEFADDATELSPGIEVALLPPVSGGAV